MTSDLQFIRERLGRFDPAFGLDVSREPDALGAACISDAPAPAPAVPRPRRSRRPVLALTATAVAAAVIAAGVVALTRPSHGSRPAATSYQDTPALLGYDRPAGPDASARQVLLRIAARVARQHVPIGSGRYQYVRTRGWYLDTVVSRHGPASTVIPTIRSQWIADNGSGRIDQDSPGPGGTFTQRFGPHGLSFSWRPGSLSDNPAVLRRQLEAGHPVRLGPAEVLTAVEDLYDEQAVSSPLRAALLRIIASLPGLRYDGPAVDRAGRRGIAVSLTSRLPGLPTRYVLVIDPRHGEILGADQVLTQRAGALHVPIPSVVSYTLYLDARQTSTDR
jgi:hypothetical protein